jgi:hypothetical protein
VNLGAVEAAALAGGHFRGTLSVTTR